LSGAGFPGCACEVEVELERSCCDAPTRRPPTPTIWFRLIKWLKEPSPTLSEGVSFGEGEAEEVFEGG